jgi:predicted MPP superfamily phosphohydrolase
MPKLYFFLFLAIVLSVYAGMHGFVYWRLAAGFQLPPGQRQALKLVLISGALLFIAGEILNRLLPVTFLLYVGSVWLGVVAISLAVFLLEWPLSLLIPRQRPLLVLAALSLTFLISGFSTANAAFGPVVREKTIPIPGLPPEMDGFTIVQLSDLHLGNLTSLRRLGRIVERTNALRPDLICVTGDTLDGDICRGEKFCELLGSLQARHGVVAVTGNHEFYVGITKFLEMARLSNWTVLRNRSWIIDGKLAIAGLEEDTAARFKEPGPDLDKTLSGIPAGMPTVLLYHQPKLFAAAVARGVDLQLSGHTHAGQIPPMDILVWLTYDFPAGLYRRGNSHIYTSPGTGTWGPPMRFLSRSQIVKLTLVR